MDLGSALQWVMHLDASVLQLVQDYGFASYLILFIIIFLETGVIITPFLPGDSLLFAAGAVASIGGFKLSILLPLLFIAAVVGDGVNYFVGKTLGRRIVDYAHHKNFIINYDHIATTERFYDQYGGKAILIARFIPIVRTFAPFVAGIAHMNYRRFAFYNISGAALWVALFVLGGYWFGNIPVVKDNFTLVILAIIVISFIPAIVHLFKKKN